MPAGAPPQISLGSSQHSPGLTGFKGPTSEGGERLGEGDGKGSKEIRGDGREGDPKGTLLFRSHPMSEILKNTPIAEVIWLAGAATQTFAQGGKYPRAATGVEAPKAKGSHGVESDEGCPLPSRLGGLRERRELTQCEAANTFSAYSKPQKLSRRQKNVTFCQM